MLIVGVIIYDVHKEGGCGVMKFLEILQTIVDGFWGGRCGVCVWGEGILFLIFWRSTCTERKYLFPNTCKYFPTFFSLLFHCFHTESMWKFQGSYKKEAEFPGLLTKTSCGISTDLGIWRWNLQGRHTILQVFRG